MSSEQRPDAKDRAFQGSFVLHPAILGQLAEGVIVTDVDGRIVLVNEAAAAIHGIALLDVTPDQYSHTYKLYTEEGSPYPPLELPLARAVRGETVIEASWRIRREDGSEVRAVGSAKPLHDETGLQTGAVLTVRDETARIAAERELRELNSWLAQTIAERTAEAERARLEAELAQARAEHLAQAKSDFLANMSHEIRTPLNGVVAVADMLARSALPERERDMAEIIRASGDTLQRLLSDILDMARIESGQITIETAPFHAGAMVRAVCGLSQLKCDEKGVRLTVEIAPEIDEMVDGDMVRVRQVVTNLLSNAVKFTDKGEVRLVAERLADGRARFAVSDTGVGFDMADKGKVLGRFQQADSSITRRFGGTGLGLSICCNLAELMGGVLDCSSRPGVGSTFWMELPLAPASQGADAGEAGSAPLGLATGANDEGVAGEEQPALRVLVADDHPTNRQVVRLMLDGMAELTCVEDGAQAVAAFEQQPYDVILMDMQMPVMDGLSALQEIRRREAAKGLARTPAVMLTANALPEHVASALAAGADLHLSKPFTAPGLFQAIEDALDGRVTEAAASAA